VPSLRNLELTAPYFHNGGQRTIRNVVEFYNRGGDFREHNVQNIDFEIGKLNLTSQQIDDLVAFLSRPLTDPRILARTVRSSTVVPAEWRRHERTSPARDRGRCGSRHLSGNSGGWPKRRPTARGVPPMTASPLRIYAVEHWSNRIRQRNPSDACVQNAVVFEFPESREDRLGECPPKYSLGV
jgi:hypothetical protein